MDLQLSKFGIQNLIQKQTIVHESLPGREASAGESLRIPGSRFQRRIISKKLATFASAQITIANNRLF
jgi:hypothetical protein